MDGDPDCENKMDEIETNWKQCNYSITRPQVGNRTEIKYGSKHKDCKVMTWFSGKILYPHQIVEMLLNYNHIRTPWEKNGVIVRIPTTKKKAVDRNIIGMETLYYMGACVPGFKQDFYHYTGMCLKGPMPRPTKADVLGVPNDEVSYPTTKQQCSYLFGQLYVVHACLGNCKENVTCPIKKISRDSCINMAGKVFSITRNHTLTIVTKDKESRQYTNNLFSCDNKICIPLDQVKHIHVILKLSLKESLSIR